MNNIQTSFPIKKLILIFVIKRFLPLRMVMSSHKGFFTIFSENTAFSKNLFNNNIPGK